jgi:predicted RNA-binding protein with PUA-like domain
MACWLFKEEPDHYSYADLERDGQTVWAGVENNLALKHLRKVCRGDQIFYYHTGKEKAVVAIMEAVSDAYADPDQDDPKLAVVDVKPIRQLEQPVTLQAIKAEPSLADWDLVRIARLSVMPVSTKQWKTVLELSGG